MALINFARHEIEVKIVFYGPALSGKTTNVEVLHRMVPATQRGELHSLRTEQDRTLFFDYMPLNLGEIAGFKARFKLFTVPGQMLYKHTRREVLQGADAVVFVADSSESRREANLEAFVDLEENLREHGLDIQSIPLVIQLNKRDAPDALPVNTLLEDLNPFGVPYIEATAADGRGVLDTLRAITDLTGHRVRENLSGQATAMQLTAVDRPTAEDDRNVVREHLERIRRVRPSEEAAVQRAQRQGHIHAGQVDAVLSELVVRSEDVTPPEPIPPMDGPVDEMPVRFDEPRKQPRIAEERTPARPRDDARPAQERDLPQATSLHAFLDAGDLRFRSVRSAVSQSDGSIVFELVADSTAGVYRHPVHLHLGLPPAPPQAPTGGALRWAAFGGATFVTAIGGMLLGLLLGWLAFAR
jgi:signal recognition particle receptor subunit beta